MKAAIGKIREEYAFSERRACRLLLLAVGSYRYVSRRNDEPLQTRLVELARAKPRFGYRRLHVLLEREGEAMNHKRPHRVYREAGLAIRRRRRKHCIRAAPPTPLEARVGLTSTFVLRSMRSKGADHRSPHYISV